MTITHTFVSAKSDGPDATLVQPGDWNADHTVTINTADIADDAVTYAKMQNVSATDMVLGRSTAGAGNVEEIACTAAGRALLDDASASAQRTTLGLAIGTDVQAYDALLAAIAALTTVQGNIIYATGADAVAVLAPGTSGYFLQTQGAGANPTWAAASVTVGAGTFTRDISLASSTQDVPHGMSVTPKAFVFTAAIPSTAPMSVGVSTITADGGMYDDNGQAATSHGASTVNAIVLQLGAGSSYAGQVSAADGTNFTVTWVRDGTPTGTATMAWLAIG